MSFKTIYFVIKKSNLKVTTHKNMPGWVLALLWVLASSSSYVFVYCLFRFCYPIWFWWINDFHSIRQFCTCQLEGEFKTWIKTITKTTAHLCWSQCRRIIWWRHIWRHRRFHCVHVAWFSAVCYVAISGCVEDKRRRASTDQ